MPQNMVGNNKKYSIYWQANSIYDSSLQEPTTFLLLCLAQSRLSSRVQASDQMRCHMNIAATAPQPLLLCSAPITAGSNTLGLHYSAAAAASQAGTWGHTHRG